MRKYKCCIETCPPENSESGKIKYYHFRKHDHKQWLDIIGDERLKKVSIKSLLCNYFVCSKHFSSTDYNQILSPFKTKLNSNALPKVRSLLICKEHLKIIFVSNFLEINFFINISICSYIVYSLN